MSNTISCGHCRGRHYTVDQVRECSRFAGRALANARVAPAAPTPAPKPRPNDWQIKTPRAMVEAMRDGRYAVEVTLPGQPIDWVFLRVARPTHGKRKGQLVIQTQHSDYYKPALVIYPTGSVFFFQNNRKLDLALMMVAADPYTSAINYGRELGCCSRCGRELTDERSRHYSIGPECEKHWPEIINLINETSGPFIP